MESLNQDGKTLNEFLAEYDAGRYHQYSVTVDMPVFTIMDEEQDNYRKLSGKSLKILLIKRKDHPFIHQWALPGGFLRPEESLDEAALRELREETGAEGIYMEQLYTFGEPGRDPRTRVITCAYMALADSSGLALKADTDAMDTAWFDISYDVMKEEKERMRWGCRKTTTGRISLKHSGISLAAVIEKITCIYPDHKKTEYVITDNDGLAFDHARIIIMALERLRSKVDYTDIALNLMPALFTLTELQRVYEVILDKELLMANFRRKTADLVEATDQFTENAGHRPSRLYRRRVQE